MDKRSTVSAPRRFRVGFDFDGTLLDSFEIISQTMHAEALRMGCPASATALDPSRLRKLTTQDLFAQLGVPPGRIPELIERVRRSLGEEKPRCSFFEGLPAALTLMHARGWWLGILSSNSTRNVTRWLEDLAEVFAAVVGDAPVFEKAERMQTLALDVYVGDEVRDIEAAKAAGTTSVAVAWGFHDRETLSRARPDRIVDSVEELLAVLEKLAERIDAPPTSSSIGHRFC